MRILKFILGPMQTNCYFIVDDDTRSVAVVDPAANCDIILQKLRDKDLKPEYIILTHAHFDHMMALEELRQRTSAPLLIHKLDAESILSPDKTLMLRAGVKTGCKPAERLLEDGDIIKLGNTEIKVMHTPGHTVGSICLIAADNIISGDTLFRLNIGRYDFYGGDYEQLRKSLKKLSELSGEYKVFPGHGQSTSLSYEKENNIYMK